jgi:hypothetical protein
MANAKAAKSWPKHFALARTVSKNPTIVWMTVVSAAVEKGMALILSSGKVAEAASNSGQIFGIAAADGDVGDEIPVYAGDRNNVFVGQVDNADISSQTYPFECDLVEVSNEHRVDVSASVEDVFLVLGPETSDDLDDTTDGARVYFQIKRSSYDDLVAAR